MGGVEVILRGGNVTSDFITKYLGEVNHANVREKHPKKQEEHMQKLQEKWGFAYTRWWKKAQVEKGRR